MNKIAIVLALAAVCIGLAEANIRRPFHGGNHLHGGLEGEEELELLGHGGRLHGRRPGLHGGEFDEGFGGFNDFDEGFGGRYPHHRRGGRFRGGRFGNRGRFGHGGHGFGHGIGHGGRLGRLGGFGQQGSRFGAIGAHNGQFNDLHADDREAGLVAGGSLFDAGQHFNARNDQGGLSDHQLHKQDETIIKKSGTDVKNVDGFANSQGINEGSHIAGAQGGLAAGEASSRLDSAQGSDSDFGAIGGSQGSSGGIVI